MTAAAQCTRYIVVLILAPNICGIMIPLSKTSFTSTSRVHTTHTGRPDEFTSTNWWQNRACRCLTIPGDPLFRHGWLAGTAAGLTLALGRRSSSLLVIRRIMDVYNAYRHFTCVASETHIFDLEGAHVGVPGQCQNRPSLNQPTTLVVAWRS